MAASIERYLTLVLLISSLGLPYIEARKGRKNKLATPEPVSTTTPSAFLICPKCSEITCTPKKESKLRCKGSIKRGICGCCPVCAKVAGESCGGEWNYLGECDTDLQCVEEEDYFSFSLRRRQNGRDFKKPGNNPEGRCRPIKSIQDRPNENTRPRDTCKPKCSPSFCENNLKAICSAVDVVDEKRSCQGNCQHTSCQACSWVEPEPDCGHCELNDFKCIKKYSKCIKRQYCTRNKFPCREKPDIPETGKFQCFVPKCAGRKHFT